LNYKERQELRMLIDKKTREKQNIKTTVKRDYNNSEYMKKWEQRKRIERLAQDGLIELGEKNIMCVHCKKESSKYTHSSKRHEANCPRTPIEVNNDD
jgi:glutamate racemase